MLKALTGKGLIRVGVVFACLIAITPGTAQAFSKAIWGPAYVNGKNQFPIYKRARCLDCRGSDQLGRCGADPAARRYQPEGSRLPVAACHPSSDQPGAPLSHAGAAADHRRAIVGQRRQGLELGAPSSKDFAAFATAAAREYPQVHLWMIWGEPTRAPNFQPLYAAPPAATTLNRQQQIAPHNYARLLDAAYGALKGVSRKNLVIGGSTYTTGDISAWAWIKYLKLPNGHAPRMDMYGHNPFGWIDPSFSDPPVAGGCLAIFRSAQARELD